MRGSRPARRMASWAALTTSGCLSSTSFMLRYDSLTSVSTRAPGLSRTVDCARSSTKRSFSSSPGVEKSRIKSLTEVRSTPASRM
jgi:hypothetical protein